jgi:hypothetical protein
MSTELPKLNVSSLAGLFKGDTTITLAPQQLLAFVSDIANTFAQYRSATKAINDDTKETLNLIVKQVNLEHERIITEVDEKGVKNKKKIDAELSKKVAEINKIRDEIMVSKPKDGESVDKAQVVKEVFEMIKLPEQKEIILDGAKEIRDKLESLQGDERLDIEAIKGLKELLAALEAKRGEGRYVAGPGFQLLTKMMDVLISNPANGDILSYDSALLKWKNIPSSSTVTFADGETPGGTIDGVNVGFTLAHTPAAGSLKLFVNGQRMSAGGVDYTLSGTDITLVTAPPSGSILLADYRY